MIKMHNIYPRVFLESSIDPFIYILIGIYNIYVYMYLYIYMYG